MSRLNPKHRCAEENGEKGKLNTENTHGPSRKILSNVAPNSTKSLNQIPA